MSKRESKLSKLFKSSSRYFDNQNDASDDVLIEIRNVTKNYKSKRVLKGVNLTINEGEHVAILGANGAGKTTLTEIIATIKEPSDGKIYYSFGKKKKQITPNVGMQFQDSSYPPTYKVIDLVNFFAKSGKNRLTKEEVEEFMVLFNLWDFKEHHAISLSGGQRQRLNILLSVINSPKLLILDELSTGLDIDSIERIQKYILDYVNKNNITLLLVSHNPDEVKTLTDRVVILDKGVVYQDKLITEIEEEFGDVEAYLYNFFEEKSKNRRFFDISEDFDFKDFVPKKEARTNLDKLLEEQDEIIHNAKEQIRFTKWRRSLEFEQLYQMELEEKARKNDKVLAAKKKHSKEEVEEDFAKLENLEDGIFISVRDVKKSYGKKEVLKGITFDIKKNEKVALIGANGAGKSTLTEIIATIKDASSGKVAYSFGSSSSEIAENVGMQFQDSSYPVMYTVKNLIYFFARANYNSMSTYEIHKLLKTFNLYNLRNNIAESLSGGQKQRLNVLLTLLKKPKLLILDEVSTGLDIEAVEEIKNYILKYIDEYKVNLILVSHNIKEISDMADRIIALKDGEIYEDILIDDLLEKYNEPKRYYAIKKLTSELFAKEPSNSEYIIDNFNFLTEEELQNEKEQALLEDGTTDEKTYELKDFSDDEELSELIDSNFEEESEFETAEILNDETVEDGLVTVEEVVELLEDDEPTTEEDPFATVEEIIEELPEEKEETIEAEEIEVEVVELEDDDSNKGEVIVEEQDFNEDEVSTIAPISVEPTDNEATIEEEILIDETNEPEYIIDNLSDENIELHEVILVEEEPKVEEKPEPVQDEVVEMQPIEPFEATEIEEEINVDDESSNEEEEKPAKKPRQRKEPEVIRATNIPEHRPDSDFKFKHRPDKEKLKQIKEDMKNGEYPPKDRQYQDFITPVDPEKEKIKNDAAKKAEDIKKAEAKEAAQKERELEAARKAEVDRLAKEEQARQEAEAKAKEEQVRQEAEAKAKEEVVEIQEVENTTQEVDEEAIARQAELDRLAKEKRERDIEAKKAKAKAKEERLKQKRDKKANFKEYHKENTKNWKKKQ